MLQHLFDLVGGQDLETLTDLTVLFLLTHQLARLVRVGRILQHLRACQLACLLLFVTVLGAEKAFAGKHAFPATRLLQIVIIDEVVVKVVETIVVILLCLLLLAVCALWLLLWLLLLFGGLLHVTSIFLHRCKRIVILDTSDHGLDKCVKAVPLAIVTRDRIRVVILKSGEVLSFKLVGVAAELRRFCFDLLLSTGDFWIKQIVLPQILFIFIMVAEYERFTSLLRDTNLRQS